MSLILAAGLLTAPVLVHVSSVLLGWSLTPCSHAHWCPLQVAEHIPAQHERTFLENIYRHAALGVVLSWAVPGQVQP